ncbi:MAG TPA: major capsid protein [Lacipirellulaceae bacterium]|nr:major capsid protein [Lacipirellulaceae bacterium]
MATLKELLYPQVIFESVVNRVKKTNDTLQRFWGMQLGGPNIERIIGRTGSYDIFDNVRTLASGRAPNTPAATTSPQSVGQQTIHCLRVHEKMPIYYEHIFPIRKLGRPSTEVDAGGADYVGRPKGILRTRFDNTREFMVSGMMRGSFDILVSGEDWIPVYSGGTFSVDFRIPSTNKSQVNGIITIPWSQTANARIFEDVLAIDSYFTELHGWPLRHVWVNSVVWGYVTNNAGIRARSGTSNVVFERFSGLGQVNNKDVTIDDYEGELRCLPGIRWHIYNGGLSVNGSFTKFFPDTMAVFCIEPSKDIAAMAQGTEYVQENEMTPAQEREVPYFWPQYVREPAKVELVGLDIAMPMLKVPKAVAPATIVF